MMKVFLSYSRKDTAARERFETLMRPLERAGSIECWIDDEQIEPGAAWAKEIEQGLTDADAAVLLVSENFHASDYYAQTELPVLLAKRARGQIEIIPIFLRPCPDPEYHYRDRHDNPRSMRLSDLQGIASPSQPLNRLPAPDQDAQWTHLSERIERLAEQATRPLPDPLPAFTSASTREPTCLSIALEIRADLLIRRYRGDRFRHDLPGVPWSTWRQRLAPLQAWGEAPVEAELKAQADSWSALLFELLFSGGEERDRLFQALNGTRLGSDRPAYRPYRVVIETDQPELLCLPWQLTDWHGSLHLRHGGWSLQTSSGGPLTNQALELPLNALLVASKEQDPRLLERLGRQLGDVQALPETDWDRRLPRLRLSAPGVETHLRDRTFDLLIYHGPAAAADGSAALEDLADALERGGRRREPFRIACLLLTDHPCPAGRPTPLELIDPFASFLSVEYLSATPADPLLTQSWMTHWLRERCAPVRAWTELLSPRVRTSPRAARVMLHGPPAHWLLTAPTAGLGQELWQIFDRTTLKATLQAEIDNLTHPTRSLRVLALCPFGTRGDHVTCFSAQLLAHLEQSLPRLPIVPMQEIGLPADRAHLAAHLDRQLLERLDGHAAAETPGGSLGRLIPASARQQGRRPVIWLDWGAFGTTPGLHPPLSFGQIRAWLDYCAANLVRHCPVDTLLVSVIAIETGDLERLAEFFQDLSDEPALFGSHFRLHEPVPLERIRPHHVLRLFADHPGLIPEREQLRRQVAQDIVARSEGLFAEAVTLLERGMRFGWEELLRESPRSGRPPSSWSPATTSGACPRPFCAAACSTTSASPRPW